MLRYLVAPLVPAALLVAAALLGGWWTFAALVSVTGFVTAMDLSRLDRRPPRTGGPVSAWLPRALGLLHLPLLALGVTSLAKGGHGTAEALALAAALGIWLGQVSNSAAHELIHRGPRALGRAVYASLLFGHHASAHLLVHHVHVATDRDPNSARPGESFYAYAPRAWVGSWRAGLAAETALRSRNRISRLHPYAGDALVSAATLVAALEIGGGRGVLILLALCLYAQMQLLLSDYVQHYGLRRRTRADGRPDPAGPAHSWNAPHWYSGAFLLNAPRHSDHHMYPSRAFDVLRIESATMPVLPRSLPVMAVIALWPPAWRRMMDRRAAKWRDRDKSADGAPRPDLARSPHETDLRDSDLRRA